MPTTIRDIAHRLDLSHATVSRVLNKKNDSMISEATRARVLAAAREMRYRPNAMARALVTGKSQTIALWTIDGFAGFYAAVAHRFTILAYENRYKVSVNGITNVLSAEELDLQLLQGPVDGIVACDMGMREDIFRSAVQIPNTPLVTIGVYYLEDWDFVGIDLFPGSLAAVRHLLAPGCKRVAYMVNRGAGSPRDPRSLAYHTAMRDAGLPPEYVWPENATRAACRQAIKDHVRERGCPEAIFCNNDDIAIGCYRGLCDLGVRIPDDVALVGCDGLEETEYHFHPLSTIVQPVEEMCRIAWQYLVHRIEDPAAPPQRTILQPALVTRVSSQRESRPMEAPRTGEPLP
jgi:LacI family transcriptional regulator